MNKHRSNKALIDREVDKTLQSLDSLDAIEASPYFRTRLNQAIRDQTSESLDWLSRFTRGYRLIPAGLLLFILLNAITVGFAFSGNHTYAASRSAQIREAAREYFPLSGDLTDSDIRATGK